MLLPGHVTLCYHTHERQAVIGHLSCSAEVTMLSTLADQEVRAEQLADREWEHCVPVCLFVSNFG